MKKYLYRISLCLAGIILLFSLSCKREVALPVSTLERSSATLLNLIKNDGRYSILYSALLSTKLSEPLTVYGQMTIFAPTDEAFKKYFKRKGITDISKVHPDTLKNLLKYHIYNEQYGSAFFVMGTLPTPTINGNYIRFDISAGLSNTKLNASIKLGQLDLIASNGTMHAVEDVLEPPSQTLYDWLKAQPDYTIMLEGFEKTGNADEILKKVETDPAIIRYGQPEMKWHTIFLESNTVLKAAGINSFDDLAKKYSNTYNTTKSYISQADSLNIFIRFHAISQKYFVSDFADAFKESFASGNYLIFNSTGGIGINKHTDDATGELVQVGVNIPTSNNIALNGIVHAVTSVVSLYKVKPVTVIQKFAGSLEQRVLILKNGTISSFTTEFPKADYVNSPTDQALFPWLKWGYPVGDAPKVNAPGEWGSDLTINFPNALQGFWIALTTPLVFPGNYNVYVNYSGFRRNMPASASYCSFTFDSAQLGDVVTLNLADNLDARGGSTAGPTPPGVTTYYNDNQYRRFIGKVSLPKTGTHVLRLDFLPMSPNPNSMNWYSVELVPTP